MRLQRLQAGFLAATAATCPVSIFAAQLFFGLGVAVYLARLARRETTTPRLAVEGPLLAFAVWTLLSSAFSPDPLASQQAAKKLVLFALFYVAFDSCARESIRERVMDAALLGGLALSAESVVQAFFLGYDTVNRRPPGFLGHYMTASGLEALVLVLATARLAFFLPRRRPTRRDLALPGGLALALLALTLVQIAGGPERLARSLVVAGLAATGLWLGARASFACASSPTFSVRAFSAAGSSASSVLSLAAAAASAFALVVSQTRNAWLGAVFGLATVLVLKAPRALWLLGFAVVLVLAVRPAAVASRLTVADPSSIDRYYMWQAGIDMIRDRPVFGQGPGMIQRAYPRYRWEEARNPNQPHLHDNALQIAAERGLPCLAFWLWLMAVLMGAAVRESRLPGRGARLCGAAALGALVTLLVAGLFEYNFGDSEVLMFVLITAALPFAERRGRAQGAPSLPAAT